MERLTVSLPKELMRKIKQVSDETGLKMSRIVVRALEQHLSEEVQSATESPIRPTVLWKIKGRRFLRGPSPRLARTRVGSWRTVDLDKLPL